MAEDVLGLRRWILGLAISGQLDDKFPYSGEATATGELRPLSVVAHIKKGLTPISTAVAGSYPFVVTAEARSSSDHFDFEASAAIIPLVSSSGHGKASIKRLHYQEGRFALGTILCAVIPRDPALLSARFLYEYLSTFKDELLVSRMTGTANVTLTLAKIAEIPIPIISRAAVARLDELMRLCDELEAAQSDRDERRRRLRTTSLGDLVNGGKKDEIVEFFLQYSSRMITKPEHLTGIREAIFELAVRGRLVSQDTADHAVSAVGLADEPALNTGELPFAVPSSWVWRRLGTVAALINGDRSKNYPNKSEYVPTGVPWINTGHIQPDGTLSKTRMHHITRSKFDSLRGGKIQQMDLVYCLRGATFGKTAIVHELQEGAIASSLVIIRVDQTVITPAYARLYLISATGQSLIRRFDNGSAQPNLAASSVKLYVTPIPPVNEQERIVAKVNELMAICDELVDSLLSEQAERSQLLEALLRDALSEVDASEIAGLARGLVSATA